jgi:hypothetical protein
MSKIYTRPRFDGDLSRRRSRRIRFFWLLHHALLSLPRTALECPAVCVSLPLLLSQKLLITPPLFLGVKTFCDSA